jgi:hypothetical protein
MRLLLILLGWVAVVCFTVREEGEDKVVIDFYYVSYCTAWEGFIH